MAGKLKSRSDLTGGFTVLAIGLALLVPSHLRNGPGGFASGGMSIGGLIVAGFGLIQIAEAFFRSRRLPKKDIMRLAEQRQGLLTLGEIATALDIDPDLAKKTLLALSKDGLANQRWQEFRKNLWEFPDYMTLPITQSIELAKAKGGRLTENDLVASGHTRQTARQTLDTLAEKGLAQPDPASATPALIVTTQ